MLDWTQPAQARHPSRHRLLGVGASVAALACGAQALADTTVNGGSAPVATSTANAGQPDNVIQSGALTVVSGPALILDSDNAVTDTGTVQMQDVDNVTGVQAQGGHAGSVLNSGSILLNETVATTTTDSAGNVTGPFAKGSGRWGIRVVGPGVFTGPITNAGTITIQGADSAAISIETPLAGTVQSTGAITATGDRSFGIRSAAPISGQVLVSGGVSAAGAGAQAISIGGDMGGGLLISSAVTATGYHSTARGATTALINDAKVNDIAQGGPAVSIAGNLGGGLLVAAPPAAVSASITDANGDGLADASETKGGFASFGSAPALQVGAVGRDVALGVEGVGDSAYGLVIEGTVAGAGLRDGVSATGLQLGVDGGGAVSISNGLKINGGEISAAAFGGDATALHLEAGATAPMLNNTGTVVATQVNNSPFAARAIVIEPGASLPTILNDGAIRALNQGTSGEAVAIVDRSGTLREIQNVGLITTETGSPTNGASTGAAVAIDASANTAGLSLLSYKPAGASVTPQITGAVRLGSGDDSVSIQGGTLTGDVSFGAGRNALTVDGGGAVKGAISAQGGTLALSVGSGSIEMQNTGALNLTSLSLGAGSATVFTIDPAVGKATELDVSGAANISAGAKVGVRLASMQNGSSVYTLVRANQLTAAGIDQSLLASMPYLFDSQLGVDAAAGTVSLTLTRKSAAELALPASIAGGYDPVVAASLRDPALGAGLLGQTDRAGFVSGLQQLLPEHSGGLFRLVQEGTEAFARPLDDRRGGGGCAWAEEVNFLVRQKDAGELSGYSGQGFGLIGGYERAPSRIGTFGVTFGGVSSQMHPRDAASGTEAYANLLELGGYWRLQAGPLAVNARVAGDYLMAKGHRATDLTAEGQQVISGVASGHWHGVGLTSRVRASYQADLGAIYLRPEAGFDLMQLREGAYRESGGGVLDLDISRRKTTELTGEAGLAAGAAFGDNTSFWGPTLYLGYRDALSKSGGATTARFDAGGDPFTVGPDPLGDGGLVAKIALQGESGPTAFSVEAGGERRSHFTALDLKLAAHMAF